MESIESCLLSYTNVHDNNVPSACVHNYVIAIIIIIMNDCVDAVWLLQATAKAKVLT